MLIYEGRSLDVENLSKRMASFNSRKFHGDFNTSKGLNNGYPMLPWKNPDVSLLNRASPHGPTIRVSETYASEHVYSSLEMFSTHAILDTGASRCIIGDRTLKRLQQSLPQEISDRFR